MTAKFRLGTVLRVASIRERERERELAVALRDERVAEQICAERGVAYAARPADTTVDGGSFIAHRNVVGLRARAVVEADEGRAMAAEALGAARDRWMVATRDRRAIDELRERHDAAQAVIAARASQRALDDLAKAKRRTA